MQDHKLTPNVSQLLDVKSGTNGYGTIFKVNKDEYYLYPELVAKYNQYFN
jgi:hypothetical protein